ncbi:MAG: MarR family transcriptional regulator [Intestinibacter sp.]|nr:MarR family transcriptional regulator [Intestinibacter sp.]MDY4573678.1 MarR family transcriptional regulator [Intestinibacter sp.]
MSKLNQGGLFVLNYLVDHQKTAYPKDLSKSMVVSTARIATILNHLEKDDFITRTTDPKDNRQIIVKLTEKGDKYIQKQRDEMLQKVVKMLECLGPEDALAYIRIQKKLISSIYNEIK